MVDVSSEHVLRGASIQIRPLREMLSKGLCRLTGEQRSDDAWHRVLKPDDVIGVKFNEVAARTLGTTMPLLRVLMESLASAGFGPERIVVIGVEDSQRRMWKTRPADMRFSGEEVDFGCGSDQFLAALTDVTAIINVPFLKTHHLATMTGCLKNLSHGLIRHPSRFHGGGCNPAIARINAATPLRSKVRLHLVNALRVICDGGSRAAERDVEPISQMLFSTDGVAADSVGYDILNRVRRERNLVPLMKLPMVPAYLRTAAELGLGEWDGEKVQKSAISL